MNLDQNDVLAGFARLNELFSSWSIPSAAVQPGLEARIGQLQNLGSELMQIYRDAYGEQMEAILSTNERLVQALQAFPQVRDPQDILLVESDIAATLLEGLSLQGKSLAALTQRVQEYCATIARNAANEMDSVVKEATSSTGPNHGGNPARAQSKR